MAESTPSSLQSAGISEWLIAALENQTRNVDRSIDPYLLDIGEATTLDGTRTTVRCRLLHRDAAGNVRVQPLVDKLVSQVVDYCIPRSRIAEAQAEMERTGSVEKISQLDREARELFTSLSNSGEGGELLLYFLLEVGLGIPQILCKMPLKTNSEMHVHGTDGVHAEVLADGALALYWCESKLYKTANDGIDACAESIAPFLLDPGDGAARRDTLLLRDNLDIGDPELTSALKRYLDPDDELARSVEVRGACLVGCTMDDYPKPYADDGVTLDAALASSIEGWRERISSRVEHEKLTGVHVEVFCVPFPCVQAFRDALRSRLGINV